MSHVGEKMKELHEIFFLSNLSTLVNPRFLQAPVSMFLSTVLLLFAFLTQLSYAQLSERDSGKQQ